MFGKQSQVQAMRQGGVPEDMFAVRGSVPVWIRATRTMPRAYLVMDSWAEA